MKRTRKIKNNFKNSLTLFDNGPVKIIRQRKNTDNFIENNIGKDTITILEEFLIGRKKYILSHYPEHLHIVLFELELYYSVLQRIKKGINSKKLIK
jgi:hypothetical protein